MRAFTALVWREISERRALLAAAAVASLLPVLAPLLPATGSNPAADVRELVMWIMVGFLVPLFALLLGVSFIGRDLSEGRLGFYFAQPLSGPTIWFGKLTAVALLIWGAQVLIMLPTVLLAPDASQLLAITEVFKLPYQYSSIQPNTALPLWLVPLGIVLLGHAVSVVWRGRSVWLVLDLIALLVVAGGAWAALRPFLPQVALKAALAGVLWIVAWVFLALIAAGAAQLTFGRVDLRRAHRSLSTALWGVLAVAVGALVGWSSWVRSATPADLLRADRVMVASGEWIAVSGPSNGRLDYRTFFILNPVDGRWVRAGSAPYRRWFASRVWFSGDGLHAYWAGPSNFGQHDLMHLDLEDPDLDVRGLGLDLTEDGSRLAISHEGDRISVVEDPMVAVYDVESGRQLAAAAITGEFNPDYSWFDGPGTLVISASTERVWEGMVAEYRSKEYRLDVASKELTAGEEAQRRDPDLREETVAQDGRRLKSIERDDGDRLVLVEGEDAHVIADLGEFDSVWETRHLGTGGFFVLGARNNESFIEFFDADGVRLHRAGFGADSWLRFAGEAAPGRLLLGCRVWRPEESESTDFKTCVVNMETGDVEATIDGFYPMQAERWRGIEVGGPGAWQPGSVASRLLKAQNGSLHLLDSETGTLKQLIPAVG
jgi:hypothetical protein